MPTITSMATPVGLPLCRLSAKDIMTITRTEKHTKGANSTNVYIY